MSDNTITCGYCRAQIQPRDPFHVHGYNECLCGETPRHNAYLHDEASLRVERSQRSEDNEKTFTRSDQPQLRACEADPRGDVKPSSMPGKSETRIKNGIEFYDTGLGYEDCQCARCGSSCSFHDCDNCGGEGEIEDTDWQCEGEYHRCDWCRGAGGYWRCLSGEKWCRANPMPGREDQPVMGSERDDE